MDNLKKVLLLFIEGSQQVLAQQNNYAPSSSGKGKDSLAVYDRQLTVTEMQEDLRLFRDIREKANSGFYRYRKWNLYWV